MLNSIIQVTNAWFAQVFGAVERGIDAHRAADANAGLGARDVPETEIVERADLHVFDRCGLDGKAACAVVVPSMRLLIIFMYTSKFLVPPGHERAPLPSRGSIACDTRPTRSAELLGHRTYCGILASRSRWLAFEVSCRYGRRSGINFWMPVDTLYLLRLSTCHGLSLRCALRGQFRGPANAPT
jgi:hypothetical protein